MSPMAMEWRAIIYETKPIAVEQKLVCEISRFSPGMAT